MKTVLEFGIIYGAEPYVLGQTERRWLDNLKIEVATNSSYPINVVINLTWLHPADENRMVTFISDIGTKENTKLWFAGSVDGTDWIRSAESFKELQMKGYNYEFVGNAIDHFSCWMPALLIQNNDLNKVKLVDPKYLFLSYNRKPRPWRKELVTRLIEHRLHIEVFITFEAGVFPEIDAQTAEYDQDLHTIDLRFTRPEDIFTLGSLEIWNNTYSVIVSETEIQDSCQLSEKSWKPLLGLRPYFLNSNPGVVRILDRLGFYTPGKLFNNPALDSCSIDAIIDQLKSIENPVELYNSQLDMLIHNQNRFIEIANSDPTKILNWPQVKLIS